MSKFLQVPCQPSLAAANVDRPAAGWRYNLEELITVEAPVAIVSGTCPFDPLSRMSFPEFTEIHRLTMGSTKSRKRMASIRSVSALRQAWPSCPYVAAGPSHFQTQRSDFEFPIRLSFVSTQPFPARADRQILQTREQRCHSVTHARRSRDPSLGVAANPHCPGGARSRWRQYIRGL